MKVIRIISLILFFIITFLIFCNLSFLGIYSCYWENCVEPAKPPYYTAEPWETKYNEYEHYENIKERTENFIKERDELKNVYSYEVHNIYSLYDYPEYFLVEIACGTYSAFYEKLINVKNYYVIGFIEKDEYYYTTLNEGESCYKKANVFDYRLYYDGYLCMYEKDYQIFEINIRTANENLLGNSIEFKSEETYGEIIRLRPRNSQIYGK